MCIYQVAKIRMDKTSRTYYKKEVNSSINFNEREGIDVIVNYENENIRLAPLH